MCELYPKDGGERADSDSGAGTDESVTDDWYEDIALSCIRYLGYTSLEQVDRLTIPEYRLLMQGVRLREIDKDYRNHLQAWLNFQVQGMKKAGKNKQKPIYSNFKRFFDYEKRINEATGKVVDKFAGLKKHLAERGKNG